MTYTINGIGTSFVAASKVHEGTYDAVEAFVIFFLPIVPYKTLHIVGSSSNFMSTSYNVVQMRYSGRIALKAIMRLWSIVAIMAGVIFLIFAGMLAAGGIKQMIDNQNVGAALAGCCLFIPFSAPLVLGGFTFFLYWWMDRYDHTIKTIIGVHELGSADPYYWPDDVLASVESAILQTTGMPNLAAGAEAAFRQGDLSFAMKQIRMAQRVEPQNNLDQLFQQVLDQYHSMQRSTHSPTP